MRQKILKIVAIGAVGFVLTYAALALVTQFLILPSLIASGLLMLVAIASYVPPNGIPFALSLVIIVCVFSISGFLNSSAFSAVPQREGSAIIPLVATFTAFAALTIFGFRGQRTLE